MTFKEWAAKEKLRKDSNEYRRCQRAWERGEAEMALAVILKQSEDREKGQAAEAERWKRLHG